jgi:hypothetical protein
VRSNYDHNGSNHGAQQFLYRAQDIIAEAGICTGMITAKLHGGMVRKMYITIESMFVNHQSGNMSCAMGDPVGFVKEHMSELIETSSIKFGRWEINILQGKMTDIQINQRIRVNEVNLLGIYFDGKPEKGQ